MPFGVYVHYPFCARHCPYCDFTVTVTRDVPHEGYRDAVLAELRARAEDFAGRPAAVSLYFGGGTPGLWPAACVGAVIDGVAEVLGLAEGAEVTVECNPEEVALPHLVGLRAAGVNRISLGVQSFDDALLRRLGRQHDGEGARRAVAAVVAAGFQDYSVDLMHGAAGQRVADAVADATIACALGAPHVSTYQLTIEPRTSFGARAVRGESLLVEDDALAEMYEAVRAALAAGGVQPYEISNAARPGHAAVHNMLYWTGGEYLGLGAGAHGYRRVGDGAVRWSNERHAGRYARAALAGAPAEATRETIDADTLLEERVLCGLRLDAGLPIDAALAARFGANARRLAADGLLTIAPDRWRATPRGRALLDRVITALVTV